MWGLSQAYPFFPILITTKFCQFILLNSSQIYPLHSISTAMTCSHLNIFSWVTAASFPFFLLPDFLSLQSILAAGSNSTCHSLIIVTVSWTPNIFPTHHIPVDAASSFGTNFSWLLCFYSSHSSSSEHPTQSVYITFHSTVTGSSVGLQCYPFTHNETKHSCLFLSWLVFHDPVLGFVWNIYLEIRFKDLGS